LFANFQLETTSPDVDGSSSERSGQDFFSLFHFL